MVNRLPSLGTVASRVRSERARRPSDAPGKGVSVGRKVLATALLIAAFVSTHAPQISRAQPTLPAHYLVANDLDGDGRRDLLVARVSPNHDRTTLAGVRGVNGKELWKFTEQGDGIPVPSRVGRPARPGAVLIWDEFQTFGGAPVSVSRQNLILRAVSGRGAVLWNRTFLGALASVDGPCLELCAGFASEHLVLAGPVFDANRDGSDDIVVVSFARPQVLELVSGSDGATLYRNVIVDPPLKGVVPIGDFSGDGAADYILLSYPPTLLFGPSTVRLSVRRGTDGEELWSAEGPWDCETGGVGYPGGCEAALVPLGDMTGDGRPELAAGGGEYASSSITILDGATGARLWTRPTAGRVIPVGDLDGDNLADVVLQSQAFDQEDCKRTHLCGPKSMVIRYEAFNGRGQRLYSRSQTVRARCIVDYNCSLVRSSHPLLGTRGDLNGDGIPDAGHYVVAWHWKRSPPTGAPDVEILDAGVVSGRTGARLWSMKDFAPGNPVKTEASWDTLRPLSADQQILAPIGDAHARPSYLLTLVDSSRYVWVFAHGPKGGPRLWTTRLKIGNKDYEDDLVPIFTMRSPGVSLPLIPSGDITGDRRPEVVLNLQSRSLILDGATGRPLRWAK
jgi:hypothetical protein